MDVLLHPKVVHFPVALAVLTPVIAVGILVAWWRGWFRQGVWAVVMALQSLLVLSGVVALQSGEVDEEVVERVVPEPYIEQHEEAAEAFVWTAAVVLAVTVVAGMIPARTIALGLATLSLAGMIAVFGLGYRVGRSGGSLVYDHGAANASLPASVTRVSPPARDIGRAQPTWRYEDDDD